MVEKNWRDGKKKEERTIATKEKMIFHRPLDKAQLLHMQLTLHVSIIHYFVESWTKSRVTFFPVIYLSSPLDLVILRKTGWVRFKVKVLDLFQRFDRGPGSAAVKPHSSVMEFLLWQRG